MAYNCASGVCTGSDAATTQAIQLLQRTINRFASDPSVGFTPLAIDGVVGTLTSTAAIYALTSINFFDWTSDPANISAGPGLSNVADNLISMINGPSDLLQVMTDTTNVIGTGADLMGRPLIDVTPPSVSANPKGVSKSPTGLTTGQAAALAKKPGMAAGALFGLPFDLPNWAVYGGLAGIVGLIGHHYYKKGSFKRFGFAPKMSSKR